MYISDPTVAGSMRDMCLLSRTVPGNQICTRRYRNHCRCRRSRTRPFERCMPPRRTLTRTCTSCLNKPGGFGILRTMQSMPILSCSRSVEIAAFSWRSKVLMLPVAAVVSRAHKAAFDTAAPSRPGHALVRAARSGQPESAGGRVRPESLVGRQDSLDAHFIQRRSVQDR